MESIHVTLFGPGLPSAGQTAQCVAEQGTLRLVIEERNLLLAVKFSEMQAKVAGFDHNLLQLNWRVEGAAWSLMTLDATQQKKLLSALPAHSIEGLSNWKRSTISQSLVWQSISYSLGFLTLLFALVIWQYDRVTTWAANRVSMQTEKRLGQSVINSLNPDNRFLDEGPAVDAVKLIGNKLTKGSRYQYQWYVSKDSMVNAYAIPGGVIVVNSGLLKEADSANELAAVLAHEVQHVEQKHALKSMMNSAGLAAAVLVVLGDANAVVMLMAHQVSQQYFSRQIESDADIKGAKLLQSLHMDASGMVSFFKKMETGFKHKKVKKTSQTTEKPETNTKVEQGSAASDVASWFSSHPDTRSRIQVVEQYLSKNPCADCAKLTWDKQAVLADITEQLREGE